MSEGTATLFVIDDDASTRKRLERLLRLAGWSVETHASGGEFPEDPHFKDLRCVVPEIRMQHSWTVRFVRMFIAAKDTYSRACGACIEGRGYTFK